MFDEFFLREGQGNQENYNNKRRYPESDVGMKTCPKNKTADKEINKTFSTEPPEEEVKAKGEEERDHDGPKADTGEINSPKRGGEEKSGCQSGRATLEEFLGEKVYPQDCQGTKKHGPEFKRRYRITEELQGKSLKIDEEALTPVIIGIKNLVMAAFVRGYRIHGIDCFIRIQASRNMLNIMEAEEKCQGKNGDQGQYGKDMHPV